MKIEKSTLKNKLKSYSALSGALLLASNAADAGCVVYTDINPDQSFSGNGVFKDIDLNNDGLFDARVSMTTSSTSYIYYSWWGGQQLRRRSSTRVNAAGIAPAGVAGPGSYSASAFNFGANINAAPNWNNNWSGYKRMAFAQTSNGWSYSGGPWLNATDKYLGVRFPIAGQTHFGWVRMDVDIPNSTFVVKDYAHNADPNTISYAGVVPPCLTSIEIPALVYTENDPATQITGSISLTNQLVPNMDSARVQIVNNYFPAEDVLAFTNQNGITGTWNAVTGIMSLQGSATSADYQLALRSVTYQNMVNTPSPLTRTVSYEVWDTQNSIDFRSDSLTRDIMVIPVNDLPLLSNIEVPALVYTENDPATTITNTLAGLDLDNQTWDTAIVTVVGNFIPTEDVIAFTNQNGITGTYNPLIGQIILSGSATVANYVTAMQSVTYMNTSENPSSVVRTVSYIAKDTAAWGNTVTRQINVVPVNDVPVLANIEVPAITYTENDPATQISATITGSDLDDINWDSAWVQISNNYINGEDVLGFNNQNGITGSWNAGTGTLTLTGLASLANYQAALRSVTYFNTSQLPSQATRTVSFMVNDGALNSNTQTRDINVVNVNDPSVLANIEVNPIGYIENDFFTQLTGSTTVNDIDNLTLVSGAIQITGNFALGEDELGFTNQNGIVGLYNPATGTMNLTGVATLADYQTALRAVRYMNNSDNPSVLSRTVSFVVNDGLVNSNVVIRKINITAVNDAPVLSLIEVPPLNYTQGAPATQMTASVVATDVDNVNLTAGSIQITGNYFNGQDVLAISNQAGITSNWNAANGILTLTGVGSVAAYQTALQAVTYQNIAAYPNQAMRTVTFMVTDGFLNSYIVSRDINVINTVSVDALGDIDLGIIIFPNPNNGSFNITVNNEMKGAVTLSVTDVLGKIVKQVTINKNNTTSTTSFQLTDLSDGMYFVQVSDGNTVQKTKFVKGN